LEVKDGYSLLDSQVTCPVELRVRLPAAGMPWRKTYFFSSRKDAEPQRNCGALGLTFRRGGLAPLRPPRRLAPQNCGDFFLFFFSQRSKDAKEGNSALICLPEAFASLRLCETYSFFSFSRK
jgi:hypothetical protein